MVHKLTKSEEIQRQTKKYDPSFVAKILKSKQQVKEGKVTVIAIEDLWK